MQPSPRFVLFVSIVEREVTIFNAVVASKSMLQTVAGGSRRDPKDEKGLYLGIHTLLVKTRHLASDALLFARR